MKNFFRKRKYSIRTNENMNTQIEQSEKMVNNCDPITPPTTCFIHEGKPNINTSNFYRERYPNGQKDLCTDGTPSTVAATSTLNSQAKVFIPVKHTQRASTQVPSFDTWIDLCGNLGEHVEFPLKQPILRRQSGIDIVPLHILFPIVDFDNLSETDFKACTEYMTDQNSDDYITPNPKELVRYIFDFNESQSVLIEPDKCDPLPEENTDLPDWTKTNQSSWSRETNRQDECFIHENTDLPDWAICRQTNTPWPSEPDPSIEVVDWSLTANQYISILQDPNNIQKSYCPRTDIHEFFANLTDCFELEEDAEFEELNKEIHDQSTNQSTNHQSTDILSEDQPPALPKRLARLIGNEPYTNVSDSNEHNKKRFYVKDGACYYN